MNYRPLLIAGLTLCAATWADAVLAREVTLRGYYEAKRPIVRLGDVADFAQVPDDQRGELERLPLFPAPSTGLTRKVTAQDVRELMSLRGLSLPTLRLTGECRVAGTDAASEAPQPMIRHASVAIGEPPVIKAASSHQEKLTDELIVYLQTKDRIRTEWKVELLLTKPQKEAIAGMERLDVSGGQAPWTGRQAFTVRDRNAPNTKPTTIKADVERIARAVVARRNINGGSVIRTDDVELAEINPASLSSTVLLELDSVLGKEAKRTIPAGQTMQTNMLQRPLVVKRGELITVYSVAAGIQIKATAKSLADAALGDTILLEGTETKKQFQARVTAPQEAMVFVDTPKVAGDAKPTPSDDRTARKPR